MELDVLLATRNGGCVLARTLRGYAELPRGQWRLIVVDNGSTDDTPQILDDFRGRLPLTVVQQSRPGKNRSLNAALPLLQAPLVVLTDDDAVPDPGFLAAWAQAPGGYDLFAGRVRPLFSAPAPSWLNELADHFPELFALNERPESEIEPGAIFGPNMAVRRSVFDVGLKFSEAIGPDGARRDYPMGSETEFCERAARELGLRAWFMREPLVHHIVRPNQLTREFARMRAYRHGRGTAMTRMPWSSQRKTRLRAYLNLLAAHVGIGLTPEPKRVRLEWDAHWWRGFLSAAAEGLKPSALPAPAAEQTPPAALL